MEYRHWVMCVCLDSNFNYDKSCFPSWENEDADTYVSSCWPCVFVGQHESEGAEEAAGWGRGRNKSWEGTEAESAEGHGGHDGVTRGHVKRTDQPQKQTQVSCDRSRQLPGVYATVMFLSGLDCTVLYWTAQSTCWEYCHYKPVFVWREC